MKLAPPPAYRLAKYGLTTEDWQKLYDAQDGKCLLCVRSFTEKRRPHVDHDHLTGDVRGLLCHNCNWLLGTLHEARDWLWRAFDYLTNPFAERVFATPRRHVDAAPPEERTA